MCGIFGIITKDEFKKNDLNVLSVHAEQRGKDSSGLMYYFKDCYRISKASFSIKELLRKEKIKNTKFIIGHSRLVTTGLEDNQPVHYSSNSIIHNGIIVNFQEIWDGIKLKPKYKIDTEILSAITDELLNSQKENIEDLPKKILNLCKGVISCAIVIPSLGKLCLFSNNGSLYLGKRDLDLFFSSESFPLKKLNCSSIEQIKNKAILIDIPKNNNTTKVHEYPSKNINLIPELGLNNQEEKLLKFESHDLKRCTKCILPETMPYIDFDHIGVCNYCRNYSKRNQPQPKENLFNLVEKYRRKNGDECIIPFSGGRDSCYGLHLIVNELKMRPITYTYDWGMVTDLGRRNISRMSAQLGVENIIVAADISKKRQNIKKNMVAWLKSPNLGMVSILTAGDKHFFRYINEVKKQTGISLNFWGVNPLEVTHFKSGFLGIPPYFDESRVYTSGALKQIKYQFLRFKAMLKSPGYFNLSLWDTLSGEYYRSYQQKIDYFHIFDYWKWNEKIIDETLLSDYEWEKAPDTNTTWRIGDGTAAIYNYIYYSLAGFTEHDTFRSNQIREGDISRAAALELVLDENRPRYPNIKWYLDAINLDYFQIINKINNIKKIYEKK